MFDDVEDEDDLLDDLDDDDLEEEEEVEAEAPVEPVAETPKPKKKAKAAPAPVAEKAEPSESQLAELGLSALKQSFVNAAKAEGYVAADFDGIGLKGIDESAQAQFVAEAKKSHEDKVAALAAQGFVFSPEAVGGADLDAQEAEQAAAWGPSGPGMAATGDEKFSAQIQDEVQSGDTMSVIGTLLGKGGLSQVFIKGKK